MKIKRAKYRYEGNQPQAVLTMETDSGGKLPDIILDGQVYRDIRRGVGIALGSDYEGKVPEVTFNNIVFDNHSSDPAIVAMAERFIEDTSEGGKFVLGKVDL